MKKKWLIAFLVLTLCINTFSHYSFVYAQTNQSTSITEKSNAKNYIPVEVLDVLQRISKYSEASSEDIRIICSYYGVEEKALRELEKKGYDFITSVNFTILQNQYKINKSKIEKYLEQGLDINDLYPKDSITSFVNTTGSNESLVRDLNPPEELETNYEEYINPEDGSYTFKQTDLVLPIRNGFDLVIAPRYSSARAELFNNDNIWGYPSNDLIYTDEEYSGFLGSGWTFGYSYIEVIYNKNLKIEERERILHLSNGQSYTVILGDTEGNRLYEYPLLDMKLSLISELGEYELTYKDGRREVFSRNGALQYIADKYNNRISFTYSFFNGCRVPLAITDSMGRKIQFTYTPTETGVNITMSVPEKGTMTYVLEKVPGYGYDYELVRKIDFTGRVTEFSYTYDEVLSYGPYYGNGKNVYANLVRVTYPNHSYTLNTYEKIVGNKGGGDNREYYRIVSNEIKDGNTSYNRCTYSYIGSCEDFYHEDLYSPTGTFYRGYSTKIDDGKVKKSYYYHKPDLLSKSSKREEIVQDANSKLLLKKLFTYYKDTLISSIETTKYGNSLTNKITSNVGYVYNDYGDILEYTNELGNKTYYTYEMQYHRKASETDSSSSDERIEWCYDLDGETMTIYYREYDELTDPSIKTYQVRKNYNSSGNVTSEVINNISNKTYLYNNNNYLSSITSIVTDRNGIRKTIEQKTNYNPNTGELSSFTDGNGNTTYYYYDSIGRLVKVTHPDQSYATIQYSSDDKNVTFSDENQTHKYITYNALGKMKSIRGPKFTEDNEYDSYGRLISTYNGKGYTRFQYDCLDRIIKTTNPDGTSIITEYDDLQNIKIVTNEKNEKYYYYYDLMGNLIKETSPNNNITTYTYNRRGQLIATTNPRGYKTQYEYNYLGNAIKMIDNGNRIFTYQSDNKDVSKITNVYSTNGLINSKTYDELGRVLSESGIGSTSKYFEYDGGGNLIKEVNPNGKSEINYTYDSRNRMLSKSSGRMIYNYTYDGVGNVLSITGDSGTMTYEYADSYFLQKVTLPDGKSISYQYDSYGNRKKTIDYFGKEITYEYNIMNKLERIQTGTTLGESYIYYNYYPDGLLQYASIGSYFSNGSSSSVCGATYSYDLDSNLIGLTNTNHRANSTINSFNYSYDSIGNQINKFDSSGTTVYTYDPYNRVKTEQNPDGVLTTYEYDINGNIDSVETKIGQWITSSSDYVYDSSCSRLDYVVKETKPILETLSISPAITFVQADQQITFSVSGIMTDGVPAPDELLNETVWSAMEYSPNPIYMLLSESIGTTVTGIIPKTSWDAMSSTDMIVVKATLHGKIVEAKIFKGGIQQLLMAPVETYADADQQITFSISGTMDDGRLIPSELLNEATWTVDSNSMVLSTAKGKTVTGMIPRIAWDAMLSTDIITVRAILHEKVVEAKIRKNGIQLLAISPIETYANADEQINFTVSGTSDDGSLIPDQILNESIWTVDSTLMMLSATQGKTITGVVPKVVWDTMLPSDMITVRAKLQGREIEARVYKRSVIPSVLEELSITPTQVYAQADEQLTFTIAGTMSNGSTAVDELLNTATWTVSSPAIVLNTSQGKTITGVIPKAQWDMLLPADFITVRATLLDKAVEARVYKYASNNATLKSLSITPSRTTIIQGQSRTFTVTGLMSDGTTAPDSLLSTASWRVNNNLTLSSNFGKTVTVYNGAGQNVVSSSTSKVNDLSSPIVEAILIPDKELIVSIGNITAGADIDTELTGYSYVSQNEKSAISQGSGIISNNAIGIDNEISSTETYRTVTYFKYDNNGNMIEERISKPSGEEITTYKYNDFNQLIEVINLQGITTFTYYPSGLRESKTHGDDKTKYYYDGQNIILETKNNILSARNIYGIGSSPAVRQNFDTSGNMANYLYLLNGHGDVVTLVDEQCNTLKNYEYDIYGEILQANGIEVDNPIGYAGQYYDTETGLYYLRARYYDPEMMRFISEDTYKGEMYNPPSLNLYVYCVGNPIRYIDPSGNKFVFENGASEENKKLFAEAITYIVTSETGKKLYEYLNDPEKEITILFEQSGDMDGFINIGMLNFLHWAPLDGLILKNKSIQSAALGLAHEMGHAAVYFEGSSSKFTSVKEEEEYIVGTWETPIAKELCEPIRINYNDSKEESKRMDSTIHKYIYTPWYKKLWKKICNIFK